MQLFSQPPVRNFQPTVIPQDVPVYRIKEGKFFADDELYEEGSIIVWPEQPNLEMEPLNDLALKALTDYVTHLDDCGRAAAKKAGKMYISLADALSNSYALANQEGRRVTLLNGKQEVPLMGGSVKKTRKSQKVDLQPEADTVGTNGKLSLDGRKAVNAANNKGM